MPGCRYVEEIVSAAMLATNWSAGVAPEVTFMERVTHTPPPSANKAAHSGFETQWRRHQKSKTEVSVAPQKGLKFSKLKKIIEHYNAVGILLECFPVFFF